VIKLDTDVKISEFDPDFWDNLKEWLEPLPFDVFIESGYRSIEKQRALRDAWEKDPKHNNPANRPGESAHNFGKAADIHPIPPTKKRYYLMSITCRAYHITGIGSEAWHYQSDTWKKPKTGG